MRYSIIATQGIDDFDIIGSSPDMGDRLINSALANIFPAGSDWGDYAGARSFRFVPIAYRNYLLSYTLILNQGQGEWEGQLHGWGLVGPAESFLTQEALVGKSPRELFIENAGLFAVDPLYDAMSEGLVPAEPSTNNLQLPWWYRVFLSEKKCDLSWRFSDPAQWSNIENWLYLVFLGSLRGGIPFLSKARLKTFSTLALSISDESELIGFPDSSRARPTWGFV